jgi:cyanuric acid amidohydrolase
MPIAKVHRISAVGPDDVSGIAAAIAAGRIDPNGVMAVLGKTEGNGLVNDFSRGFATLALTTLFRTHLGTARAAEICIVMSGGTEGAMAPHWVVFERAEGDAGDSGSALAIGRAQTEKLPYEHLGRGGQVEQVAAGVRTAMQAAAINRPGDVHYVQVKCPLLTAQRVAEADARAATTLVRDTLKSMGLSRAASALGVAVALGEIDRTKLDDCDIGANVALWSGCASASAGIELEHHEIVVLGMSPAWSGPLAIDHALMADAIDVEPVRAALARLGLNASGQLPAADRQPPYDARRLGYFFDPPCPRICVRGFGQPDRARRNLCFRRRRAPGTGRRRTGRTNRRPRFRVPYLYFRLLAMIGA